MQWYIKVRKLNNTILFSSHGRAVSYLKVSSKRKRQRTVTIEVELDITTFHHIPFMHSTRISLHNVSNMILTSRT